MNTCEVCGTQVAHPDVVATEQLLCNECKAAELPKYIQDIATFDKFIKLYKPEHPNFPKALAHMMANQISMAKECWSNVETGQGKITISLLGTNFYLNKPTSLHTFINETYRANKCKYAFKDYFSVTLENNQVIYPGEFKDVVFTEDTKITKINLNFCPFCKSHRDDIETTNLLSLVWPRCKRCSHAHPEDVFHERVYSPDEEASD